MISSLDRHLFAAWTERTFGKITGNPRIAVVGNCQTAGIAYGMKVLLPRGGIDFYQVQPRSLTSVERLAATLKTYDFAFCADFPSGFVRGGDSSTLQELVGTIVRFPVITFAGFHPDTIYIQYTSGITRNLPGPMGPYHSAITLFAFLAGLSAAEANALFHPMIFQRLGYFDIWEPGCTSLLAHAASTGIDLSNDLLRWTRRGCFMHTVNHPKAYVLFDLARTALKRVAIAPPDINFDDYALDPLAGDYVYPVYPPIAEWLGIKGSYLFKQTRAGRQKGGFLLLRQFIEESYRAYARVKPAMLQNARVGAWLDDGETVRTLRDFAASNAKSNAIR
jgi:Polysaccharide biosynthesis enzyme WcbI